MGQNSWGTNQDVEQKQGREKTMDVTDALMVGNKQKTVLLRAPVLVACGYGVHSRQIFRWLKTKNVDLTVEALRWGTCTWLIDQKALGGLVGSIMSHSKEKKDVYDLTVQVQLPNEWDPSLGKVNIGVTAAVETDRCNPKWIESINKMDIVIVPSEHTKNTILNSGEVKTEIVVVPESYLDELAIDDIPPMELGIDTSFNFLMVGQLTGRDANTDRKNTFNSLKWLCETFKSDKDVGIILKASNGRNSHIDRKTTTLSIQSALTQIRKGPYPKIHLLHGYMTSREMASLYRNTSIKAYLALTRGEGYGLPILEAAVSGIPVITTDWSGHLDFMNKGRFIKVDYDLAPIHKSRQDNNIFMEGTKWAEPREASAKKILKKFRKSSEIPKQWATKLSETLLEDYSQEAICSQYDLALKDLF
jgi:hypothetical protein